MDPRQLLRPLPLSVAAVLVLVAAADAVRSLSTPPDELPVLLEQATVEFRASQPVVDFRRPDAGGSVVELPQLQAGGWSEPEPQGTWIIAERAAFHTELPVAAVAAFGIECRSARGPGGVATLSLSINGAPCGELRVAREWSTASAEIPPGVLVAGRNRVEISLPERALDSRRLPAVLVRRIGFFNDAAEARERRRLQVPATLDREREAVVLRGSGTLHLEFEMHEMVDALIVGHRFQSARGGCEVKVEQLVDGRAGGGPSVRRLVSAREQPRGRLRIPLHGRRGRFLVTIRADLGSPPSRLVLSPLRLVNED